MFDWEGGLVRAAPKSPEQAKQLARVEGRLGEAILAWCALHEHQQFHMAALTEAITGHMQAAPDSVRRILAQLRRAGHVEVECIDRTRSLYRLGRVIG
ncbi:MAG: hypothetical protein IPO00_08715 [Betaproteobacteria bacterium]|nr:hypothetical protein [Betaproteobacteria bacterium]